LSAILPRLWSFLELNARASRRRAFFVLAVALGLIFALQYAIEQNLPGLRYLALALVIALILQQVVLTQRMHDANRSGIWALLGLVPLANLVMFVAALGLPPAPGWQPAQRRPWTQRLGYTLFALLLVVAVLRVFFQISWIPSASMKPTLLVGDVMIVSLTGNAALTRGDIVVFRHPISGIDFVKRVIGLPGDRVRLQDGIVFVNGSLAPQTDDGTFSESRTPQGPMNSVPKCQDQTATLCTATQRLEDLPDAPSHAILDIGETPQDNFDEISVPPDHYFLLGDNRDDSVDSRFPREAHGLGLISADLIKGRVTRVLFSSAGPQLLAIWTWRPERFLLGLQ